MLKYPHLFTPLKIGNMVIANRVCHVPTDVSSSNADGSVSERDIHHHSEIAKGGAGLIIVGATSPDGKTGRPTVTGLVADSDTFIPGLARLAESMHKYGAKCVVQL
ncbi:MAG: NADH oxidase, partial [Oscillospiraceae bacterium]|nr:NADH oxidase [Oscillospiraceae bacterium]